MVDRVLTGLQLWRSADSCVITVEAVWRHSI